MKGYKIHYGEIGHDCWALVNGLVGQIMIKQYILTLKKCKEVMEDVQEQFPDKELKYMKLKYNEKNYRISYKI